MNRRVLYRNIKVILLLNLSFGLYSCIDYDELEQQDLQKFNQRYAPEYKIIDRILYVDVDWKMVPNIYSEPLKLKIPMSYLDGGIDEKGRVGNILDSYYGPFDYDRPKDPNEKRQILSIDFAITASGQPVPVNSRGDALTQEDNYVFSISTYTTIGRPQASRLTNQRGEKAENIFRAKDINGLQNYKDLSCYDIEELKAHAGSKRIGYEGARFGLEQLANKAADDLTPKNCLSNELLQFWISPPDVPDDESVGIYCGSTANCVISFRYKTHGISIITRKNRFHVIPKWQEYRQQVIKTIQQFETP